jgi:hypothetical protein
MAAAAANRDTSPLDFLLGVMRDPNVSLEIRIRVAQAAAPFIHGFSRRLPGFPVYDRENEVQGS